MGHILNDALELFTSSLQLVLKSRLFGPDFLISVWQDLGSLVECALVCFDASPLQMTFSETYSMKVHTEFAVYQSLPENSELHSCKAY